MSTNSRTGELPVADVRQTAAPETGRTASTAPAQAAGDKSGFPRDFGFWASGGLNYFGERSDSHGLACV